MEDSSGTTGICSDLWRETLLQSSKPASKLFHTVTTRKLDSNSTWSQEKHEWMTWHWMTASIIYTKNVGYGEEDHVNGGFRSSFTWPPTEESSQGSFSNYQVQVHFDRIVCSAPPWVHSSLGFQLRLSVILALQMSSKKRD